MHLYLSSYRIGDDRAAFARFTEHVGRALVIFNALDPYAEGRSANRHREFADLAAFRISSSELDLREYAGDPDGLRSVLGGVGLVWVVGGNTFALLDAMAKSDFGAVARPLVDVGSLRYGGYSAGACATGPDLWGCHLIDDPDEACAGAAVDDFAGLGWVPWRVVPHWHSDHDESAAADDAVAYLEANDLAFRAIRDGQALIVDGDETTVT